MMQYIKYNLKRDKKFSGYLFLFVYLIFFGLGVSNLKAVTYLYSHGFADTGRQARKYMREYTTRRGRKKTNEFYIIDGECKTFNYPDVFCKPLSNIFQTSLGQENELQALQSAYFEAIEKDNNIVLIGVSRGASAAANFVGACDCKKVSAVVLISPFAHVYDVFKTDFFYRIFGKISRFDKDGKHPIDLIEKMDKNKPILFVCSKTDKTVPCSSTIRLYRKLVSSGHNNAYLLCLETGKHAKFLKSEEAEKFQNVTHAFYRKYGLPCKQEFAEKGAKILETCCNKKFFEQEFEQELDKEDGLQNGVDNKILEEAVEKSAKSFITVFASFKAYFEKASKK